MEVGHDSCWTSVTWQRSGGLRLLHGGVEGFSNPVEVQMLMDLWSFLCAWVSSCGGGLSDSSGLFYFERFYFERLSVR